MSLEGCYLSFAGKHPEYPQKTLTSRAKTVKAKVLKDFTEDSINEVGADNVYLLVPDGSSIAGQQKYLLAKELGTHILYTEWLLDCQKQKKRLDNAGYLYQEAQAAAPDTEPHENDEEGGEVNISTTENNDQVLENDGYDGGNVDGDLEEEVDDWENSRRMTKQDKKRQRKEENIQQQEERKREKTREKGEAKDFGKNNKKRRGQEEGEKEQGKRQRDTDEETSKKKADREQTRDRSMTLVAEDTGSDVEDPQQRSKKQAGKSRKSDNQGSVSTTKDAIRRNGLSKVKPMPVSADDSEDHSDGGDRSEDADDQSDDDEQIGNDQSEDGDDGLDMIKDEDSQSDNENDMIYDEDANSSQDEYDARARSSSTGRSRSSRASSSRAEREGSHLGPTPPPDVVISQVDKLELVRDPDDKSYKTKPVKSRILFMWGKTYLVVALPGISPRYPKQERAYLILASRYKTQADAYRNAGGRVLETFDKFNLEGLEVEDMVINIVASTPDDSKSVILARRRDEERNSKKTKKNPWLLYSRTTFNQAFRGRAGDHTINTRRIKTGQPALAQTRRERGTPDKYLRIQGI